MSWNSKSIYSQKCQRSGGTPRFHTHHGSNIVFGNHRQTAIRSTSFANAITFSEKPLAPGEIFLVEVEDTETGWSGHMRMGLTQLDPNTEFELPLYALPDLVSMGPCWLYAITKRHNNILERYDGLPGYEDDDNAPVHPREDLSVPPVEVAAPLLQQDFSDDEEHSSESEAEETVKNLVSIADEVFENNPAVGLLEQENDEVVEVHNIEQNEEENALNTDQQQRARRQGILRRQGDLTWTPCGFIQHRALTRHATDSDKGGSYQLPTDVGSRIGIMFVPTGYNKANMHFIINGEDQGPCSRDIPYTNSPVYAVVDVYGSTKTVRTCQVYGVDSLQSMCRDVILHSIQLSGVTNLPLPNLLKKYLLFH